MDPTAHMKHRDLALRRVPDAPYDFGAQPALTVSEFGRAPICEGGLSHDRYGRDHNGRVGSAIITGGGFRKGTTYGVTDDWGWRVAKDPVHNHDLHATVLHQLGLDHEKLVVRHRGRDFRLTDVAGRVVKGLIES